jgi:hypothetical protein
MLGFWPSDAVLLGTQAALVCGPRPNPPPAIERLRAGAWAWIMPVSLGATIAVLAAAPRLGIAFAWAAVVGVPLLAVPAIRALQPLSRRLATFAWGTAVATAAILLALAWSLHGHLVGDAAAVALTALSAATLASYLAALAPVSLLKVGVVAMAALDAVLVFGQLLQGPNRTLVAATPGADLPHLQAATFGSAVIGYGDLFIAAVLGTIVVADANLSRWVRPWQAALVVLVCAAAFDLLFFVVDVLPATVPVAVAMLLLSAWRPSARSSGPLEVGPSVRGS